MEPIPEVAPIEPMVYEDVMWRAALFDIETTDFNTGGIQNHMLCTSILEIGTGELNTYRLRFSDKGDDRRLLSTVVKELEKFDFLIGHYIISFDLNWILSRLMFHNMPSPNTAWFYYDTFYAAKRIALRTRKSLEFLIDFFRVEGEKTRILPVKWQLCTSRKKNEFYTGMKDVVYHCEKDVLANRQIFNALFPRDRKLVNLPRTRKW
jgi:hypothetical protein